MYKSFKNAIKLILFLQVVFFIFLDSAICSALNSNPNIVLITIDTLRADHLSCYGYYRKTTPYIDELAGDATIFTDVIAPSSWTSPSMVSLFTSLYPINHGVVHGFVEEKKVFNQEVFSNELDTLAEILKKQGYTTFGVASNLHLSEEYGFARGFDYFECLPFLAAPSVNEVVYSWKDAIKQSGKYFLWIHYFDPHWVFHPREPWIEEYDPNFREVPPWIYIAQLRGIQKGLGRVKEVPALETFVALYDSEINYVDHHLKKLVDSLQFLDNSILIITSDHGEEFLEHGMLGHGYNLYTETIKVPLIIKLPQQKTGKAVDLQVSLLDITPTILAFLDIPLPEKILGKPLLTWDGNETDLPNRFLYAELERDKNSMKVVQTEEWKYIYNSKGIVEKFYDWGKSVLTEDWRFLFNYEDRVEGLYNRKQDIHEKVNVLNENVAVGESLKEQLLQWVDTAHRYPASQIKATLTQEVQEKLKALGYITDNNSSE